MFALLPEKRAQRKPVQGIIPAGIIGRKTRRFVAVVHFRGITQKMFLDKEKVKSQHCHGRRGRTTVQKEQRRE